MSNYPLIKVTSRSFSKHPILKNEILSVFKNTVFNTDGPETGLKNIEEYLIDADGVILGLEKLDFNTMTNLKKLKIISKYGVGIDNVDLDAAHKLGIKIGWTGGINKRSVSEQALSFMIGLSRNLFKSNIQLKNGIWNKDGGVQLTNKCVGIIGCGHIGTDLIKLLQPFNVKILVNDLTSKDAIVDKYNLKQVSKDELLLNSDIVSIHVPLTEDTFHMVDEEFLGKMKKTAFLINTSRGAVINQKLLKASILNENIAGAALDVYEIEPPNDSEFLNLPNLITTPHIGGNSNEAILNMGRSAILHLKNYFI